MCKMLHAAAATVKFIDALALTVANIQRQLFSTLHVAHATDTGTSSELGSQTVRQRASQAVCVCFLFLALIIKNECNVACCKWAFVCVCGNRNTNNIIIGIITATRCSTKLKSKSVATAKWNMKKSGQWKEKWNLQQLVFNCYCCCFSHAYLF